jgi:hypothetical protein
MFQVVRNGTLGTTRNDAKGLGKAIGQTGMWVGIAGQLASTISVLTQPGGWGAASTGQKGDIIGNRLLLGLEPELNYGAGCYEAYIFVTTGHSAGEYWEAQYDFYNYVIYKAP